MLAELYAVKWKPHGKKSSSIWAVHPSLRDAKQAAQGCAASDGGGTWKVYSTRVEPKGKSVRSVLDRVLAQGSS